MTEDKKGSQAIGRFWQGLVQLWIVASLVTFFFIRLLGSQTAQRLLNELQHRHRL